MTDDPKRRSRRSPEDPDSDILAFVDRGDVVGALRVLMERHGTAIYRYCREALRDAALAEDVQQQVFIEAHRDLPRFEGRSTLRSWLFGIARHRVLDAAKKRSRARSRFGDLADEADIARAWTVSPNADLQIAVRKAMEHLDDWQRSLVLLRFQANLPLLEIAEQCEMSTQEVNRDLERTIGMLKKMLSEDVPEDATSGDSFVASRPAAQLLAALSSAGDTIGTTARWLKSPLRRAQPRIARAQEPRPFESIGELRAAHAQLGERRRAEGGSASFWGDAEDFVKRGCATGVFLDDADERWSVQGVLDYWAAALERAGWQRPESSLATFDIERAPALPDEDCPYRGLDAFEENDSHLFFGREAMVERLTEQLEQHRLVALVGPSGCGKSSLALAGMVARARQHVPPGQAPWRILPPMVPGARPHDALMRSLGEAGSQDAADVAPVLCVVDQLEELFTMCDSEAKREAFVALLLGLVSSPTPHRVVLTMRSDFESFVARYPALYDHYTRGRVAITPMSAAELRQAIEGPAALVGLVFETGVIDRLLHDVLGEPAGLPLLQFTLRRLWDDRRRNRVTRASYDRVGGGRQALALAADAVYGAMIPEDQRTARRILLRVGLTVDPRYELTRTRVPRSQFQGVGEDPARVDRVLEKLIEARLLRVTAYPDSPEPGIEVAHEALVRNWPRLAEWLQDAQASLLERRRLDAKVEDWIARGRGIAGVLDRVEIAEARRWMTSEVAQQLGVRDDLRALVAASQRRLEQSEREAEQTRQLAEMAHQLRGAVLQEQGRALLVAERPMQALPYLLAARTAIGSTPVLQMLFSQASSSMPVLTYPVNLTLTTHAALSPNGELLVVTDGFAVHIARSSSLAPAVWVQMKRRVCAVGFRADRVLVLTSIPEPAVHVFEISLPRAWEPRERTNLHGADAVAAAAFSTDGRWALTTGSAHNASLWDTTTGALVGMLPTHRRAIHGVSFGAGTSVITACADGTAQIWDARSGERLAPSLVHRDAVYSGAFSPDGTRVVTACADGTAQIWDARDGTPKAAPLNHRGPVRTARFSADGARVITGSDDHTARVWDAVTGRPITYVLEHPAAVQVALFHPSGERVLTGGADRTPRLWRMPSRPSCMALAQARVLAAALSPDGTRVVTGSEDHSARIWNASTGAAQTQPLAHECAVLAVAFSADGARVATAGADRKMRVWDATTGTAVTPPLSHPAGVPLAAFNVGTTEVAVSNEYDLARLWDATKGIVISPPRENTDAIGIIAFSIDGRRVLTASGNSRAAWWDAAIAGVARFEHLALRSSAWKLDGKTSATEREGDTAHLLDHGSSPPRVQPEHYGPVHAVAVSPDGQLLATGSEDMTARLWKVGTGEPACAPLEHLGAVVVVRFTPDGSRVITASRDHTVQIWDVSSGKPLTPGLRHGAPLRAIDLDVHGERLLTVDLDGIACVWDLSLGPGALEEWKRIASCSPFALVDGVLTVNPSPGSLPPSKT